MRAVLRLPRVYEVMAVAWPLVGVAVVLFESLVRVHLGSEVSAKEVGWSIVGWIFWFFLSPVAVFLSVRFPYRHTSRLSFAAIHGAGAVVLSAVHIAIHAALEAALSSRPGDAASGVTQLLAHRLPFLQLNILVYCVTCLSAHIWIYLRGEYRSEREKAALERRIAHGLLQMFKLRLQPEFVDAKLRSIEQLAELDCPRAELLITRFSRLLRQSLAVHPRRAIADELAYVAALFGVERVLDPSVPRLETDVAPGLECISMPSACLAPIVHAILRSRRHAWADGACLGLAVTSDGSAVFVSGELQSDFTADPGFVSAAREVQACLEPNESLQWQATERGASFVYRGPLSAASEEEGEDDCIEEQRDTGEIPRPMRLAARTALIIAATPLLYLIAHGANAVAHVVAGEPLDREQSLLLLTATTWLAWPLTLPVIFMASKVSLVAPRWKRGVAKLVIVAAVSPVLWALLVHTLGMGLGGEQSLRQSTAAFLRSGSRTTDFLVLFSIAAAFLAYRYYLAAHERSLQVVELSARLAEVRARQLRLQLNPHFLLNALNSVAALLDDPPAARLIASRLRAFVARVLANTDRELVHLREELELLETYVAIENVRFDRRLELEVRVDGAVLDALVPGFVLQPLVENAIRHGLLPQAGGRITITAAADGDALRVDVRDNGRARGHPGVPHGVGLANTRSRLRQLYGARSALRTLRLERGFSASLTVPLRG